ncbi:hypothetical protein ACFXPY_32245 [Streptomyces sp. NPDC059153]|uniref:hypothetical protein n=1 Tax=Streptomyces sp. NPDC059153 TaxID=3346743 RepID=UPI0036A91D14
MIEARLTVEAIAAIAASDLARFGKRIFSLRWIDVLMDDQVAVMLRRLFEQDFNQNTEGARTEVHVPSRFDPVWFTPR